MRKSDGTYTYFVPDVAYHITKLQRGFDQAINIQGSDHHGTIARVRAGLQAVDIGIPQGYPDYVLHKMVTVMKDGEEVKISKRAGSYVTVRDLIDWSGAGDVTRAATRCASSSSRARPTPSSCSTSTSRSKRATRTRCTTCSTPTRASARCWPTGAAMSLRWPASTCRR